jgi:hypothetical protein
MVLRLQFQRAEAILLTVGAPIRAPSVSERVCDSTESRGHRTSTSVVRAFGGQCARLLAEGLSPGIGKRWATREDLSPGMPFGASVREATSRPQSIKMADSAGSRDALTNHDSSIQPGIGSAIHFAHPARTEGRDDFVWSEFVAGRKRHERFRLVYRKIRSFPLYRSVWTSITKMSLSK